MINRLTSLDQKKPASGEPAGVQYILPQSRTTPTERFLLLTTIAALPLQDYFPDVAGMSFSFLIFAALAAYVIVNRPRTLGKIWYHPVFIAAYAFIGVCALLELASPLSSYHELTRFGQMIGGAVCVAVICRDRLALAVGLYGHIAAALWVSVVLCVTSFGMLHGMGATSDFNEASKLRAQAFGDKPLGANVNALAFFCTEGAVVAFALSLSDRLKHLRTLLLGVTMFCLVASFLPMSRGAAVSSVVAFAGILYIRGVRQGKALILVSILGLGVFAMVPDAIWSRMAFSTEKVGEDESRTRLYTAAFNRLPEYFVSGVGSGNFYNKWGIEKGLSKRIDGVVVAIGAHNTPLQITINWGVLGLAMFLWIIWFVCRSIPLRCGRDELLLALVGILITLGLMLLKTHGFYSKSFAFGLGMIVGARQWIWPAGIVSADEAVDAKKEAAR